MVELSMLLLPILLSAVLVFIASSVIHMGPFWHRTDFPKLEKEDQVMDALRPLAIPPGEYVIPRASGGKEMRSPEYLEKRKRGPVAILTVWPNGDVAMGKTLVQWFLYTVVVSIFVGYVTGRALPAGAHYLSVFRFAGATAFAAYVLAQWQESIWFGRSVSMSVKHTIDGLIYALLTAGVFGWLWPR